MKFVEKLCKAFRNHINHVEDIGFVEKTVESNPTQDLSCKKDRTHSAYKTGEEVVAIVTGITDFGVFVQMKNRESALIHQSQLLRENEELHVVIGSEIDAKVAGFHDGEGLSLTRNGVTPNSQTFRPELPAHDILCTNNKIGHEAVATIIEIHPNGLVVQMVNREMAFIPSSALLCIDQELHIELDGEIQVFILDHKAGEGLILSPRRIGRAKLFGLFAI